METIIDVKDEDGRRILVKREGTRTYGSITFANGEVTTVLVREKEPEDPG